MFDVYLLNCLLSFLSDSPLPRFSGSVLRRRLSLAWATCHAIAIAKAEALSEAWSAFIGF
jgi:hypothetical protein